MKKVDPVERAGLDMGRRELMELLGASVALAGLGACTQSPREKILPFSRRVPERTPGMPLHYATSTVLDGFAVGVLARSDDGRPTKIEGNPEHPASLGATGVFEQASVLDLYDPARVRAVRFERRPASWEKALARLSQPTSEAEAAGFRPWIVMPPQSSPLVAALLSQVRRRFPAARICFHAPLSREGVYQGARSVFGRALEMQYDFRRARITLSLGADFLSAMGMSVRWSRDFSERRRAGVSGAEMSRLYVAETMLTPTGSVADHRVGVRASELPRIAAAVLRELSEMSPSGFFPAPFVSALPSAADTGQAAWITAVAKELALARGESIVIAGDRAPRELHVLAHALNVAAGNLNRTVFATESALLEPEGGARISDLVREIAAKRVDALLILDANPVYASEPQLELGRWLREVPESFHLTYHENETSFACRWVLPLAHYLESWGDARAYDGTVSLIQPLIQPLYPAKSVAEVLGACAGQDAASGHALLTAHWRNDLGPGFDGLWPERLKVGLMPGTAYEPLSVSPSFEDARSWLPGTLAASPPDGVELSFEASPSVYDGRFANNAWLLELPQPMTKLCWGNAAVMSPGTARQIGAATGRVIEIEANGQKVEAPAFVLPGHADGALTLSLGYGQEARFLGRGVGVNAYRLRAAGQSHTRGAVVRVTERSEKLAITQDHADTRGRPLALSTTRTQYEKHPDFTEHLRGPQPSLLPVYERSGPARAGLQWAMTIDATLCTGCSSCVVACQAENNVPVVGKEEVQRGREMHWLRIDRYFDEEPEQPRVVNQPMLCQHCEKAPCEYVCPVNATVHSPDGLNEMVYNRCIGTRFCSNNCPYKVRRFNWFEYTDGGSTEKMQRNPDVTVRERGVMEKCTYCVQRIRRAEIGARVERREIAPGEVVTACQQACPTRAIQFGALEHADTDMVKWRQEPRAYAALHDLGTRPRTQYLARLVNDNPELEE